MTARNVPGNAERVSHFLALASLVSLVAVFGLRYITAPADAHGGFALVSLILLSLPLLICLRPLLQGSARAAVVLAFLALVYFMLGVLTWVDPATRLAGWAEVAFALVLFFATTLFARLRGRREREG